MVVDEARGDQTLALEGRLSAVGRPLGAALAVRDRDRQPRAGHAASRTDGLGSISTSDTRASNRSLRLRTKRGQRAAPGMSSFSADSIWQPLQTPSAKVSGGAKNAANASRARALKRIVFAQPSPAPSTSP